MTSQDKKERISEIDDLLSEFNDPGLDEDEEDEKGIEIPYGKYHSQKKYVKMNEKGIYEYRTGFKDGEPFVSEDIALWMWEEFKINLIHNN